MTFNIVPVVPLGAANAVHVYSALAVGSSFSSLPVGDPDASRRIVIFIGNASDGTGVSSVTIGGNSASLLISGANVLNICYAYVAPVPSGTTSPLVITGTSSTYRVSAYAMYEVGSNTPFDTSNTGGTSLNINVPNNGVILAARFHTSGEVTSWSGLDEDTDLTSGSVGSMASAHREFATAETNHGVGASGGALAFPIILAASFGT